MVISQTEGSELCNIYTTDVLGLIQNDPRYATIINDSGDLKNMPQKHLEHKYLTASATVSGTMLFTVGGILLMAGAAFVLFTVTRKKSV